MPAGKERDLRDARPFAKGQQGLAVGNCASGNSGNSSSGCGGCNASGGSDSRSAFPVPVEKAPVKIQK